MESRRVIGLFAVSLSKGILPTGRLAKFVNSHGREPSDNETEKQTSQAQDAYWSTLKRTPKWICTGTGTEGGVERSTEKKALL